MWETIAGLRRIAKIMEAAVAVQADELFNTNRTYINEAAKLKETSPETFEMGVDSENGI